MLNSEGKRKEERIATIYLAIHSLIFPSLPIPINYVTKRFQLRSLPITKASFTLEGRFGAMGMLKVDLDDNS